MGPYNATVTRQIADEALLRSRLAGGGGGSGGVSGTGFVHITAGVEDPAARAVNLNSADVVFPLGLVQTGPLIGPDNMHIMAFQPRDPAKAPFSMWMVSALNNSTVDTAISFGLNAFAENPLLPTVTWTIEDDFEFPAGTHHCEQYTSMQCPAAGNSYRPYFANLDRTTGAGTVVISCGPVAGDSIGLQQQGGQQFLKLQANFAFLFTQHYQFSWVQPDNGILISSANHAQTSTPNVLGYGPFNLLNDYVFLGDTGSAQGFTAQTAGGILRFDGATGAHGIFLVQSNGGSTICGLGPLIGGPFADGALWLGATTPTGLNMSVYSNGSFVALNAPGVNGTIFFQQNASTNYAQLDTSGFQLFQTPFQFGAAVVAPVINQAQSATGAGQQFSIAAQAALGASAAAGGILSLSAGAGDGAGSGGNCNLFGGQSTGGTGGQVNISSGIGSAFANAGSVLLNVAGQTFWTIGPNGLIANSTSITGLTGGTFNLTQAQFSLFLLFFSGTLSSNQTIVFPNQTGLWLIDIGAITLGGNSVILKSGTATATVSAITALTDLVWVRTGPTNSISTIQ